VNRGSDVGSDPFEPWPSVEIHVEWGPVGARAAADRGDGVVIMDVVSFSTSASIVCEQGGTALVYSGAELDAMGGRTQAAESLGATIVTKERRTDRISLSPASLTAVGADERVVLTSLNGAACLAAANSAPTVLIGSLRTCTATAAAMAAALDDRTVRRWTVIACGEHWSSVGVDVAGQPTRFAVEDWLGAGAIVAALRSVRAHTTASAEADAASRTVDVATIAGVTACISGRELFAKGFTADVELAVQLDASGRAVRRDGGPGSRSFRNV
jgi:2-phosphosulfolactate phosphatase